MQNSDFDTGGTGRPSTIVRAAMSEYRRKEFESSQSELHRFNMTGLSDRTGSGLNALAEWKGVADFSERLLGPFPISRKSWILEYGASTREIFEKCLKPVYGKRVVTTDLFYKPWLTKLQAVSEIRIINVLDDLIAGLCAERIAERIAERVIDCEADAVCLSVVTQGGIRMPVEEISTKVSLKWHSKKSMPYKIFDGCQSYGRVSSDLSADVLGNGGATFIGCTHKAICGPKEVGFVLSSDAEFRDRYRNLNERPNPIFEYCINAGTVFDQTTVDFAKIVAASIALKPFNPRFVRDRSAILRLRQFELLRKLQHTSWEIVTPQYSCMASGIVLVRPPRKLSVAKRKSLEDLIEPIGFDVIDGMVRIAFAPTHTFDDVEFVASKLQELCACEFGEQ